MSIYLDHIEKTPVFPKVYKDIERGFYDSKAELLVTAANKTIADFCKINLKTWDIIFFDSAESAAIILIDACVFAYKKKTGKIPHIITTLTENKRVLDHCDKLRFYGLIKMDKLTPDPYGNIAPETIYNFIDYNTCLVAITAADNIYGTINKYKQIAKNCKEVPFYCDISNIFGKLAIKPDMDMFTADARKFHGPMQGFLAIKRAMIKGYELSFPDLPANIPYINGLNSALILYNKDRKKKNQKLIELRVHFLEQIKSLKIGDIVNYTRSTGASGTDDILILGSKSNNKLPDVITIAIIKMGVFKKVKQLQDKFIFSFLHFRFLDIAQSLSKKIIRISFSDITTKKSINLFTKEFVACFKN